MEDLKPKANFDEFNKAHEEISESPRNFIPPVALDTKMVSGKEVINKNYSNKAQASKKVAELKAMGIESYVLILPMSRVFYVALK